MCIERDGVVIVDGARGLKAEDVVEIDAVSAAVNIGEMIVPGEASIVLLEIGILKKAVGIIDGGDVVPAECFDESVLMGAIGTLDAPLCLGRARMDHVNAQPGERPGDIGEAVLRGMVDRAKIDVKLTRNAKTLNIGLEHRQDVVGVL